MSNQGYDNEITDDDYEEFCEFDDYMESLSPEEYEKEVSWFDSISLAIQQRKNVVGCDSNYMM